MPPSKDDPQSSASTPKIAMKGFSFSAKSKSTDSKPGAPKPPAAKTGFSLSKPAQKTGTAFSLTPKNGLAKPSSNLGKRGRNTFAHDDSDDEEVNGKGKHEVITGFGEDGRAVVHGEVGKEVLVIPSLGNRDWRGEMREKRGKNLLPPEEVARREGERKMRDGEVKKEGVDVVNSADGEIQWGLSVRKRVKTEDAEGETVQEKSEEVTEDIKEESKEETPRTVDQEAIDALIGAQTSKKGPDLVIPAHHHEQVSEEEAYRRAIASAPDVSTLEDYERVPVEEFGAALLRGMGWKGEKKGGVKEVKRRQNLLGLGAKELKEAEELGAWVNRSDTKRLNNYGRGSGAERRPKASEYKRDKERRDERREERSGGGYRERDSGRERERERERDYRRERR